MLSFFILGETLLEAGRNIAKMFTQALDGLMTAPVEEPWAKHDYHLYAIKNR